ncbi:MAG: TldD/PmbA family protein [Methanomicrobiales archaeon]|nr:TldD/PmbA family protein [Methanomicrobiales archaeon]
MAEPRYWDIRHVEGAVTHVDIDNGVVESAGTSFFNRALLRVLGEHGWGVLTIENYASCSEKEIRDYIGRALQLARVTEEDVVLADAPSGMLPVPPLAEDPRDVSLEEKCGLLAGIEAAARLPGIASTRGRYTEDEGRVHFRDSSGNEYEYALCRSGFSVLAVARRGELMQMGRESEHTLSGLNLRHRQDMGRTAAERALALLDARPAKGGRMRALLDPELAGVFAHEAIGHASEGDLVKEGASIIKGRIGERIGNEILNIVDDPTLPEFGFEPVDAEGVAVARTEIIRNGVLSSYLHDRQTLAAVGDGIAGHARAVPGDVPVVRMSNTYIENGDASFDELLEACGTGILLAGSRGGQVDPGRGVFQFNAEYGYIVENGELGAMVRDVSLSGEILSTLHAIVLCGNDRKMHQGYCGKAGQSVPVSDGAPHVLLEEAVVGGSGA